MIPELPEAVTEYFELKKNVRRIKLYDYKSYSNSRYIQMNKKDISLKKKKLSNLKEIETIKSEEEEFEDNYYKCYGTIEFPITIQLDELFEFITKVFNVQYNKDREKLLLFRYTTILDGPSSFPVKDISEINARTRYMYLHHVPIETITDSKENMTLNVAFSEDSFNLRCMIFMYLPSTLKVQSVIDGMTWYKNKKNDPKRNFRALQVRNCKIVKKLSGEENISSFADSILRIDFVDDSDNSPDVKEINVCNAVIGSNSAFFFIGIPFLLKVKKDETVEETRKRIASSLKWSLEKINRVRMYAGDEHDPFDLENVLKKGQKLFDEIDSEKGQKLIMIHMNEESYRTDYSTASKNNGIQIH